MFRALLFLAFLGEASYALDLIYLNNGGRSHCTAAGISAQGQIVGNCDWRTPVTFSENQPPSVIGGIMSLYTRSYATHIGDNGVILGDGALYGVIQPTGTTNSIGYANYLDLGTGYYATGRDLSRDGRVVVGRLLPHEGAYWIDGTLFTLGIPNTSLQGIKKQNDGSYIAVGYRFVSQGSGSYTEGLIVRIEPNGNHSIRFVPPLLPDPTIDSIEFTTVSGNLIAGMGCTSPGACRPIWSNLSGSTLREFSTPNEAHHCRIVVEYGPGFIGNCSGQYADWEAFVFTPDGYTQLRSMISNTTFASDVSISVWDTHPETGQIAAVVRHMHEGITRADLPVLIKP